jgi:hypothetical protein
VSSDGAITGLLAGIVLSDGVLLVCIAAGLGLALVYAAFVWALDVLGVAAPLATVVIP